MRVMVTGPHAKQSAMYLDAPSALALPYTRYFRLVEHFVPQMRRCWSWGAAGSRSRRKKLLWNTRWSRVPQTALKKKPIGKKSCKAYGNG